MIGVLSAYFAFVLRVYFVFFQAEDGIRDLVRSRGLGDVYKRQGLVLDVNHGPRGSHARSRATVFGTIGEGDRTIFPVSYTHLTLPTSDLV